MIDDKWDVRCFSLSNYGKWNEVLNPLFSCLKQQFIHQTSRHLSDKFSLEKIVVLFASMTNHKIMNKVFSKHEKVYKVNLRLCLLWKNLQDSLKRKSEIPVSLLMHKKTVFPFCNLFQKVWDLMHLYNASWLEPRFYWFCKARQLEPKRLKTPIRKKCCYRFLRSSLHQMGYFLKLIFRKFFFQPWR